MRLLAIACLLVAVGLNLTVASSYAHDGAHSGLLEIRHSDDWAHSASSTRYTLVQKRQRTALSLAAPPAGLASGSRVVVRGRERSGVIRGSVRPGPGVRKADVPTGTWRTAVLLVNFTNNRAETWTPAAVQQRFFTDPSSVNVFFQEQSWNQVNVAGDVYGWYQLNQASTGCNVDAFAAEARSIATAAGVNLGAYDSVAYVFPRLSDCGWAGLAELPGNQLWLNGDISVRVASHELGHNMGVHHASALACPGAAVGNGCTTYEYGDPFDTMGTSTRRMAGWHLQQLGYMQPSNLVNVNSAGSYTIRSTLTQTTQPQLLKIPRVSSSSRQEYYYVDLRERGGVFDTFSLTDPAVTGVTIRIGNDRNVLRQSKLIDTTPDSVASTMADFNDAPLAAGRTFYDGNLSIKTTSVAGGVATVDVTWTSTAPDLEPPTAPVGLTGTDDGAGIDLSWSPSTDNVGVAGYRVKRDGQTVATVTGTTFRDANTSDWHVFTYCVEAFDAAGNVAATRYCVQTARYTPPVVEPPVVIVAPPPDTVVPTVTIRSPGSGAVLRRRATVRAISTDDRAVVGMQMLVDGKLVASSRSGSINVAWQLGRVKPGRHTVTIVARDAAGNSGRRSVAVRVQR
ncbi:MAG: hypothetical protein QOJ12_1692 [Thermoleophilales bacterium]|nr:hypothetical protein [Thermoleophilales bacterium]